MSFTVAIVGRPNVGKSTLFNRLIGERKAIIDDISGVTRDRIYGESHWGGKSFNVIDTGGYVPHSDDVFEKAIKEQVEIAISEADLLIFLVDVTTGITDLDDQMAKLLRRSEKKVLLTVNKVDNAQRQYEANEFYSLGFDQMFFISSINGSGTGELLDAVIERIPEIEEEVESETPAIAIIGQPNVGKSSLINVLVGEERNIVTEIAGTTRDSIHTHFKKFHKDLLLIDTAGLRKKAKVFENLEFYSTIRAIKAIDDADICLLLIDATQGITSQDLNIFRLVVRKKRGIILVVNKWDLIEKETMSAKEYEEEIKSKLAPFNDVPVIFSSVKDKQRVLKILDVALDVAENKRRKIPTSKLNDIMLKEIEKYHPPAYKGKMVKIKFVTQIPARSPAFAFFCNHPKYIREAYRNYLINKLRSYFNFSGVPISVYFRNK
ncbi:MAG: ribosome biogenesis GTPase Der [Chitinophagales bacterium]|nr:ribosome biogenesis GTPase Der [Chitinophagales bacterium]